MIETRRRHLGPRGVERARRADQRRQVRLTPRRWGTASGSASPSRPTPRRSARSFGVPGSPPGGRSSAPTGSRRRPPATLHPPTRVAVDGEGVLAFVAWEERHAARSRASTPTRAARAAAPPAPCSTSPSTRFGRPGRLQAWLHTEERNEAAVGFYLSHGWRIEGEPRVREWHGARLVEPRLVHDLEPAAERIASGRDALPPDPDRDRGARVARLRLDRQQPRRELVRRHVARRLRDRHRRRRAPAPVRRPPRRPGPARADRLRLRRDRARPGARHLRRGAGALHRRHRAARVRRPRPDRGAELRDQPRDAAGARPPRSRRCRSASRTAGSSTSSGSSRCSGPRRGSSASPTRTTRPAR